MDEVKLSKIRFKVSEPAAWESFFSDVLDLPVAPTAFGLSVQCQGLCLELEAGHASPMEWRFTLDPEQREIILSRWSFYQYRAGTSVALTASDACLSFQVDAQSKVVVHFDSIHACESPYSEGFTVRNF